MKKVVEDYRLDPVAKQPGGDGGLGSEGMRGDGDPFRIDEVKPLQMLQKAELLKSCQPDIACPGIEQAMAHLNAGHALQFPEFRSGGSGTPERDYFP